MNFRWMIGKKGVEVVPGMCVFTSFIASGMHKSHVGMEFKQFWKGFESLKIFDFSCFF